MFYFVVLYSSNKQLKYVFYEETGPTCSLSAAASFVTDEGCVFPGVDGGGEAHHEAQDDEHDRHFHARSRRLSTSHTRGEHATDWLSDWGTDSTDGGVWSDGGGAARERQGEGAPRPSQRVETIRTDPVALHTPV